jgi:hypothetical protein
MLQFVHIVESLHTMANKTWRDVKLPPTIHMYKIFNNIIVAIICLIIAIGILVVSIVNAATEQVTAKATVKDNPCNICMSVCKSNEGTSF